MRNEVGVNKPIYFSWEIKLRVNQQTNFEGPKDLLYFHPRFSVNLNSHSLIF